MSFSDKFNLFGSKVFKEDEFFLQMVNINQDIIDNPNKYNNVGNKYSNKNIKMCSDIIKFINDYPNNIEQIKQLIKKYLFIIFNNQNNYNTYTTINSIRYNICTRYKYNVQEILINYVDIDNISKNDHLDLITTIKYYNKITNKKYKDKILDITIKYIDSDYFEVDVFKYINFWRNDIYYAYYLSTYIFDKYPDKLTCRNLYNLIGSDYKLLKEIIIRFDKYEFIMDIKNYHDYEYTLLMIYLTDSRIKNIELDEIKWIVFTVSNISNDKDYTNNIDEPSFSAENVFQKKTNNSDDIKNLLTGKFYHPNDDLELYLSPLSYIISYYPDRFDLIDYFMEFHKKYYINK